MKTATATATAETTPLTDRQRSAIMLHFARFGLTHPAHRDGRLAITAALLGLEHIASVNDLDRVQAGRLAAILRSLRDTRALAVHLAETATENLIRSETETKGTM